MEKLNFTASPRGRHTRTCDRLGFFLVIAIANLCILKMANSVLYVLYLRPDTLSVIFAQHTALLDLLQVRAWREIVIVFFLFKLVNRSTY